MPEYSAPRVFVEEVSFRSNQSKAWARGRRHSRPDPYRSAAGKPEVVTSFAEFTRIYGDVQDLSFSGSTVLNHTALSAKAFSMAVNNCLFPGLLISAHPSGFASATDTINHVTFAARVLAAMGT